MAKTLNFNKLKKNYYVVTLADDKETTLMICTPTKKIMDDIIASKDIFDANTISDDVVDALYDLCTTILNHNKGGIKVPKELVENTLDFLDIVELIRGYSEFINELTKAKN